MPYLLKESKRIQKGKEKSIAKGVRKTEKKELLKVKDDIVFQNIFGKEKNRKITEHLLSLILGRKVEKVILDVNKRMLTNRADGKIGRLDIRVKFNDGEDADIEIQVRKYDSLPERILSYWSAMYTQKMEKGKEYGEIKPSISIVITDHRIKELEGIEKYHTKWNLREETHKERIFTKNIEIHILEMPKLTGEIKELDELGIWLKFIENPKNEEVREKMQMEENIFLKQAMEELEYLSGDEDFRRLVESREAFLRDQYSCEQSARREGKAIGLAEGEKIGLSKGEAIEKKQEKIQIAKKLLKKKVPIEEIVELTGLEESEIKKLEEENNKSNL